MGWMGAKKVVLLSNLVLLVSYLVYKAIEIPALQVGGWAEEGWEDLKEAYQSLIDRGLEKGGAFAVHYRGRLIAHLWGGCKNFFCTDFWRTDTTALMHSSTQLLGAVCLAVMVDRGRLNYSERISTYWPEFAANGKAAITVDQLLSHRAGLIGVEPPLTLHELKEGGSVIGERLAEQAPAWAPGTQTHYHAMTMGLYMDELFRRVDPRGRSCSSFLEREVVSALRLDLKVGLRDSSQANRFAWPYSFSNLRLLLRPLRYSEDSAPLKLLSAYFLQRNETYRKIMSPLGRSVFAYAFRLSEFRPLPLLASNGIATADSLARFMGHFAASGADSPPAEFPQRFFQSPKLLQLLTEPLADVSWMSGAPNFSFGRGTALVRSPAGSWIVGFPGTGGQMVFADASRRLGWAYLTNHLSPYSMGDDPRHKELLTVLYSIIGRIEDKKRAAKP